MAALIELYHHFGLSKHTEAETFLSAYQKVNEAMWSKFNNGSIGRDHIRTKRFPEVFEKLGVPFNYDVEEVHDYFLNNCSNRSEVFAYAHETLEYLKAKYPLSIITNGFPEAVHPKMKASDLNQYFKDLVISLEVGHRKPEPEIFRLAMKRLDAKPETSVMIGDNPKTDIRGAEAVGMKSIFFNPTGNRKSVTEWEIQSLDELIKIL